MNFVENSVLRHVTARASHVVGGMKETKGRKKHTEDRLQSDLWKNVKPLMTCEKNVKQNNDLVKCKKVKQPRQEGKLLKMFKLH